MSDAAKEITPITIEQELKQSYLDYAMSVIVGRALPDVRDGLKPVHRRVLYAMHELNNDWNKPHKKSARVVGDVIGKYHPHGDTAVYDAIVRMAQPFSMRYMLIDGQGNFGSVDGDAPAAMRYTEIRMARITHALLADLDKETVDFVPNYDETETAPSVLPTQVPNLLINGSSGIAVGMATNIPPHNLGEVVQACIALVDNPELSLEELMQYIPGPDFPTAGIINGRAGILQAYRTGRGKIYLRARTEVEENEKSNKQAIIIKELPYQVNKARLLEKIAELVKHKKVEGISGLRDESDKDGMRVVIELRRGENADVVLNNLYAHTAMQTVFGINMVALVDNVPGTLSLKQVLEAFIKHRREVITRRSIYELRKARARAHILEGLGIALANIEPMIQLIKQSSTPAIAKEKLIAQTWPAGIAELRQVGNGGRGFGALADGQDVKLDRAVHMHRRAQTGGPVQHIQRAGRRAKAQTMAEAPAAEVGIHQQTAPPRMAGLLRKLQRDGAAIFPRAKGCNGKQASAALPLTAVEPGKDPAHGLLEGGMSDPRGSPMGSWARLGGDPCAGFGQMAWGERLGAPRGSSPGPRPACARARAHRAPRHRGDDGAQAQTAAPLGRNISQEWQ
jgi:DNA gyrase/topoisomerase IV subunit A